MRVVAPRIADVLVGRHGPGKANGLEAVDVVAALRSCRTARLADLIRARTPAVVATTSELRGDATRMRMSSHRARCE